MLVSQNLSNMRTKSIVLFSDTVHFDTLSIIPGSLNVFSADGLIINDNLYSIDYMKSLFIADSTFRNSYNSIELRYRVFSINFTETARRKSTASFIKKNEEEKEIFLYRPLTAQSDFFGIGSLNSSGSISRGISVGNNQDAVVNSSLNLQLSGKLTDDISILAAITDNNIPVQPEGTTQQIQEFDKVFIQIYNAKHKLTAGDFNISNPQTHFMRFNKKAQGGLMELNFNVNEKNKPLNIQTALAGAISKGRFTRNTLNVVEGNQGPYKLRGDNNELYIIILAGTEKVYIDGKLMHRGQDKDYIMDYNTAEITFMPQNMITKDKRIIVEFEYSDKNYARSMFYAGNKLKNEKWEVQLNFYSEQDLKNQPQNQELTAEEKFILSQIGDSLHKAVTYNIDSMPFSNDFVMYKMVDTLANNISYDSVFVYSTHPDSAHYRLGFSNVGQGRGHYIQEQSAANGRVFKWIAPLNGQPQGTHEPVILLIAPQKQQMFTLNAVYNLGKNTKTFTEMSVSHFDKNTFSEFDNDDNNGIALKAGIENILKINTDTLNKWQLKTVLQHEWVQKNFKPIERYRDAEFERHWNNYGYEQSDEHITGFNINAFDNRGNAMDYSIASFIKPNIYQGLQNTFGTRLYKGNNFMVLNGFLTQTNSNLYKSAFLKYNSTVGRNFKYFTLGIKTENEKNRFSDVSGDTLNNRSFFFEQYEIFAHNADTLKNKFTVFYKIRNDFNPFQNTFSLSSKADEAGVSATLQSSSNQRLGIYTAYRKLHHISPYLTSQGIKPDDNLLGRLEYNSRFLKGFLTLNTFYELGSGLEVKNEYVYVEVPPGQGAYTWVDYNGNGVKELDEFQIAAFNDQANYIKVFVPTNAYIKAYANQFNQVVNLRPAQLFVNSKGFKHFLSRFSSQTMYQLSKKTTHNDIKTLNPFIYNIADSSLLTLNTLFRNLLTFNGQSPVFGIDYNFSQNNNKMLLLNGYDLRTFKSNIIKVRWTIVRKYFFNITGTQSEKLYESEFFSNRNYLLHINEIEPTVSYQPNTFFRTGLIYKYTKKSNNIIGANEKGFFNLIGQEMRYSKSGKGSVTARFNYINIRYNAPSNTPLAYEMLDALQPGNNITWNILFQKVLKNNMQLSMIYDGRKPGNTKVVHFGNIQIRAFF